MGGSLENRGRLVRELIAETRDAVGDRCAVAVRFSPEGHGDAHLTASEARDLLGLLGPLPDLWDLVVADYYGEEMATSRFVKEAALESKVAGVKALTGKPVVSVGRFTSPDTMLRQVRSGILDFIGAARPSIADPFLPVKIREGRLEDIRRAHRLQRLLRLQLSRSGDPLHAEPNHRRGMAARLAPRRGVARRHRGERAHRGRRPRRARGSAGARQTRLHSDHRGGGRGPGGRVAHESRLPGLAEWARVRDYRLGQIAQLPNVSLYLGHALSAQEVRDFRCRFCPRCHWRQMAARRPGALARSSDSRVAAGRRNDSG